MKRCNKCGCFHGYPPLAHLRTEDDCKFDGSILCKICNLPVKYLSISGKDICPWCDSGFTRIEKDKCVKNPIDNFNEIKLPRQYRIARI